MIPRQIGIGSVAALSTCLESSYDKDNMSVSANPFSNFSSIALGEEMELADLGNISLKSVQRVLNPNICGTVIPGRDIKD